MESNCLECIPDTRVNWRELPLNEVIRDYTRAYTSPPKIHWPDLGSALAEWGQDFTEIEDSLDGSGQTVKDKAQ